MATRYLITGGLGFMGSCLARRLIGQGNEAIIIDLDTYAGDKARLAEVEGRYELEIVDVARSDLERVIDQYRPDVIVHLAAETHVTRGEAELELFYQTNVEATFNVLEAAAAKGVDRLVHVSSDEVYGSCAGTPFTEDEKEDGEGNATSAYARSKALADDIARLFFDRLDLIVVRPSNCYGPWQHLEKAIPRWVTRALRGDRLPVWGGGGQVRAWMTVEDFSEALQLVVERGSSGHVYNIGPDEDERTNIEVAQLIARIADVAEELVYLTEYDRPGHDRRYSIDTSKLRALGFTPEYDLETGLRRTIDWYRQNKDWWAPLVAEGEALYSDELEETNGERSHTDPRRRLEHSGNS